MKQYKLINHVDYWMDKNKQPNAVILVETGLHIPFESDNLDYQKYLKWLDGYEHQYDNETRAFRWVKTSDGNTPLPADE
jgi:hypothetical protein